MWLALRLLEGQSPVLGRAERIIWAAIAGPTLCMPDNCRFDGAYFVESSWLPHSMADSDYHLIWHKLATRIADAVKCWNACDLCLPGKPTKLQWITLGFLMLWTIIKRGAGALISRQLPRTGMIHLTTGICAARFSLLPKHCSQLCRAKAYS